MINLKDKHKYDFLLKYPDMLACIHLRLKFRGAAKLNWPLQINDTEYNINSIQYLFTFNTPNPTKHRLYGKKGTRHSVVRAKLPHQVHLCRIYTEEEKDEFERFQDFKDGLLQRECRECCYLFIYLFIF